METFSPVKMETLDKVMAQPKSPVRFWSPWSAPCRGLAGGFWLAIGTALVNRLIVGGKPPVSPDTLLRGRLSRGPSCWGASANLIGLIIHSRLYPAENRPPITTGASAATSSAC